MKFKQEKPYYCGPASLQTVQVLLGISKPFTQDQWALIAGTTVKGTSANGLKRALRGLSNDVFGTKRWTDTSPGDTCVLYDSKRDHWMAGQITGQVGNHLGWSVAVYDPENGKIDHLFITDFEDKYLKKPSDLYLIVIRLP